MNDGERHLAKEGQAMFAPREISDLTTRFSRSLAVYRSGQYKEHSFAFSTPLADPVR